MRRILPSLSLLLLATARVLLLFVVAFAAASLPGRGQASPVVLSFQTAQIPFPDEPDVFSPIFPPMFAYGYNTGPVHFVDVAIGGATGIDARVTTVVQWPSTGFDSACAFGCGIFPGYNGGGLGLIFDGLVLGTSGVTLIIEFFDGTEGAQGTFLTPFRVPDFELLIYDIDGEFVQSEFFSAFKSDGLFSFSIGANNFNLSVAESGDELSFLGGGTNVPENSPSGAAILRYMDTSSVRLAFGSNQFGGPVPNPVFAAVDGTLLLASGFSGPFDDPIVVAEPAPVPSLSPGLSLVLVSLLVGLAYWRWPSGVPSVSDR